MNYKFLFRALEAKFFDYTIDESCLQFRFSIHVSRLLPRFCYNTQKKVSFKKDSSFYEKKKGTFRDFTEDAYNLYLVLTKDGKFRQLFKCWWVISLFQVCKMLINP